MIYGSPTPPYLLSSAGSQIWTQNTGTILDASEAGDHFGGALAWADFDRDGYDDLAIGVPDEDVGTIVDAGGVAVLYGSPSGLSPARNQFWTQNSANIRDQSEKGDRFGAALAAGVFSTPYGCTGTGMGLAMGVRSEDLGTGKTDAGAVNVIYARAHALSSCGNQFWTQDSAGILDSAEAGDHFGATLAVGRFEGFETQDLAVGVPEEDVAAIVHAGAVAVLRSYAGGFSPSGNEFWTQDSGTVQDSAEAEDHFGSALAAGQFFAACCPGEGLAIGVYGEDVGSVVDAGAVNVLHGNDGLTDQNNLFLTEPSPGAGNRFGYSLGATSTLLAMGIPGEDVTGIIDAGSVWSCKWNNAIEGFECAPQWSQDSAGIEDSAEQADAFGSAVAVVPTSGTYGAVMAIGVPGEDLTGGPTDAGAVNVLYGDQYGFGTTDNQFWSQDSPGIPGVAEVGDKFGSPLA